MRMPDQATDQASDAHKLHACQFASTNDDVAKVWLVESQAASRGRYDFNTEDATRCRSRSAPPK